MIKTDNSKDNNEYPYGEEQEEVSAKRNIKNLETERDCLFDEIGETIKDLTQKTKDELNVKILALIDVEIELEKFCNN